MVFEKINKIDKPIARLTKKKREKIQINTVRSKRGEIATNSTEMQKKKKKPTKTKIITDYYEQLYATN